MLEEVRFGGLSRFNQLHFGSRSEQKTLACEPLSPKVGELA
jgi:hypothetical protein